MPISSDVVNVRFIWQLHVMIKKGENRIMFHSSKMKRNTERNLKYEIYKRLLSTTELKLTKERKN